MTDLEWFSVADLVAAKLPDMPHDERGIARRMADLRRTNPALARQVPTATKPVWKYHLSALPQTARAKLAYMSTEAVPEKAHKEASKMLWARFEALIDEHKAICRNRLGVLQQIEEMCAAGIGRTEAVKYCAKKAGFSPRSIYNWQESVSGHSRQDWLAALAPSFSSVANGVVPEIAPCHPEAWNMLVSDYLRPERPGFSACYRRMAKAAKAMKWGDLPSERSMRRRLATEVPKAVQILRRDGKDAAMKLYPAQQRSVSHLHAMEVVNTDGHKLDLFVRVTWAAKPVRMTLIGIQDVYSRKVLSWVLAEAETWEAVRTCIGAMIENHDGALPYHIYMDNGRAFAAKVISGGAKSRHRFKITEDEVAGLLKTLDIVAHFVKPYSGQSKPIERAWRDLAEEISKHPRVAGCYTGNKPDAKPENYMSSAVPLDELQEHVAECIAEHNARLGRKTETAKGRSFDVVFDASLSDPATILRYSSTSQRSLWMLAAKPMTARKPDGAIHLHGNRYWHAALNQWIGKKLQVRFDPVDLHKPVKIYDPQGRYLCDADCIDMTGFTDTGAARLHEKSRKTHVKNIEALAKSTEAMDAATLGEIAERGRRAERKLRGPAPIRPVVTRLITTKQTAEPVETIGDDEIADNFARGLARIAGGDSAIIPFPSGNTAGRTPAAKRRAEK